MPIYEIDGVKPIVHPSAFVHPDAILIGDVEIGERCYVGPGASLRGDFGRILMGAGANIQDNCVAHAFPGMSVVIEENGHVGHGAILHGCHVGCDALIGMNAVVMDGSRIGEQAIVAAMAFLKADFEAPPRSLVAGAPARFVRDLTQSELEWKKAGTLEYQRLAERCRQTLKPCEALSARETDRPTLPMAAPRPLSRTRSE